MVNIVGNLKGEWSRKRFSRGQTLAALVCGAMLMIAESGSAAEGKSGVAPNVISLPSGPGSIEGLGDSFEPELNSGTANYSLTIELPPGRGGFEPELTLNYNGGKPNGILGLGWRLNTLFVQRQTEKGLPHYTLWPDGDGLDNDKDGTVDDYDEFDTLIYSNKEEVVPVADGHWRLENESEFIRFRRMNDGWFATRRDGVRLEFGLVESSRVELGGRVFRWHLDRMIDLNENVVEFEYENLDDGVQVYPTRIVYNRTASGAMEVKFRYEPRPDVITDFRPRFELKTAYRCVEIAVLAGREPVRSYKLGYADPSSWRPISLLESVTVIGRDGVSGLPPTRFGYTGSERAEPIVRLLDQAPFVDLNDKNVDLLDINADGLPDIIDTNLQPHAYYLNEGADDSDQVRWARAALMRGSVGLYLGANDVRLADMNGDGRTDLVNLHARTALYYSVTAESAWQRQKPIKGARFRFSDPTVALQDLDHDKRIDVIQIQGAGRELFAFAWINQGEGIWSDKYTWSLPDAQLQLDRATTVRADMNGDRLLDLVYAAAGVLQYYPAIGFGEFGDRVVMSNAPTHIVNPDRLLIADVNGDGRSDMVNLSGTLEVWLNQGLDPADHTRGVLASPFTVRSELLNAFMAYRQADVNGNGSTDILWNTSFNGRTQLAFADFSPGAQPNLLNSVANGIGGHTRMHYSSSVSEMVRDAQAGKPWSQTIPFPVPVVSMMEVDDGRNMYRTAFAYRDGYYDHLEKEFRGFAEVVTTDFGDETIPDLIASHEFDTGRSVEALKGKLLALETRNPDGKLFFREQHGWNTRTLARSVAGEPRGVTYAFRSTKRLDVYEGAPSPTSAQWDYKFDDFGNLTRVLEHGRLDTGWEDERVTETTYTASSPDGLDAWILNLVVQQSTLDPKGDRVAVQRNYYDGNTVLGAVSAGNLTRNEHWVDGARWIDWKHKDYDEFGNVIAIYDGEYRVPSTGHFREVHYDTEFSTYPVREVVHTGNPLVPRLEMQARYDIGFGTVTAHTDFNSNRTTYAYDTFGRLTEVVRPGDSLDAPTEAYDYVLDFDTGHGVRVNWVETRRREQAGGGSVDTRRFYDGLGQRIMTREEGDTPHWVVISEAVYFNARRLPWRQVLPYVEEGSLGFAMPADPAAALEHRYDALGRVIRSTQPDGSFVTTDYEPFARVVRDEEQTRVGSVHEGAARRYILDGLQDEEGGGRLREVHEIVKISDDGLILGSPSTWVTRYDYDLLDNVMLITDAQDNRKAAVFDGLGRKTLDGDPNRGVTTYEYDSVSNLRATVDNKQQRITYKYDGANRLIAEDYHDEGMSISANRRPDVRYVYDRTESVGSLAEEGRVVPRNTLGRLASVYDASGEIHFSYDARGRVESRKKSIRNPQTGGVHSFVSAMQRDSMDRVTTLVYPDGDRLSHIYNPRGLLERIVGDDGPLVANIDYHPSGQVVRMDYGNGVTTFSEYDVRQRLSELTATKPGEPPLLAYEYRYDTVSNIVGIGDLRWPSTSRDTSERVNNQAFEYDDLYRLTRATYGFPALETPAQISYRYDRIGNLLKQSSDIVHEERGHSVANLGAFHYHGGRAGRVRRSPGDLPGPHAVTGTIDRSLAYDDNGNVVRLDDLHLRWNIKDRLVTVMSDAERTTATYTYDYDDRRVGKYVPSEGDDPSIGSVVLYVDAAYEVRNGTPVKYVYANDQRVARLSDSLAKTDAASVGETTHSVRTIRYYHSDHLGSTDVVSDAAGSLVADFAYYPFGHPRHVYYPSAPPKTEPYKFSQKEFDRETGLQYFEARFLSGILARFISVDPALKHFSSRYLQDTQQLNAYSYSVNRPVVYHDPSGEVAILIPMIPIMIRATPMLVGGVSSVLMGTSMAELSGESYGWRNAAMDFGIGMAGVGAARGLVYAKNMKKVRGFISQNKLSKTGKPGGPVLETWKAGWKQVKIKKPSPLASHPDSRVMRAQVRTGEGTYVNLITGKISKQVTRGRNPTISPKFLPEAHTVIDSLGRSTLGVLKQGAIIGAGTKGYTKAASQVR